MAKGSHREKQLTAATVRSLTAPGFYPDGQGLYLKIDNGGAKRWIQRLVIQGKRRDIGLGSASIKGLADAREEALNNRKLARSGGDPLAVKRHALNVWTFEAAAKKVHELYKPTWRNPKHGAQWLSSSNEHVYPHFGKKRVDMITSADVLAALTPIWNQLPETARRVKQRIGNVLKWAIAQGLRTDNPADAISKALPKHDRSKIKHQKALPYVEVGAAIRKVQDSNAALATKLAMEFLILTATRSGETRGSLWHEIDMEKAEWIIPGDRMKAKRPHRVPLSPRCIELLRQARMIRQEDGDLVFPGTIKDRPLSDATLSKLLKDLKLDAVPHGLRSSFRDWAGEMTNFPREVCEFALAHVIKDKAEAAYARSDLFDKRRKLMEAWADFLSEAQQVRASKNHDGISEGARQ